MTDIIGIKPRSRIALASDFLRVPMRETAGGTTTSWTGQLNGTATSGNIANGGTTDPYANHPTKWFAPAATSDAYAVLPSSYNDFFDLNSLRQNGHSLIVMLRFRVETEVDNAHVFNWMRHDQNPGGLEFLYVTSVNELEVSLRNNSAGDEVRVDASITLQQDHTVMVVLDGSTGIVSVGQDGDWADINTGDASGFSWPANDADRIPGAFAARVDSGPSYAVVYNDDASEDLRMGDWWFIRKHGSANAADLATLFTQYNKAPWDIPPVLDGY